MLATPAGEDPGPGDAARRPLRWWDIGVVAVVLVMSVPGGIGPFEWTSGSIPSPWFGLSVGVLVVFVLLYAAMGRAALLRALRDRPPTVRGVVFLALLILLLGAATLIYPSYATLQCMAYPMLWTIVPRYARAVLASALLALAIGVGSAFSYARLGVESPVWTAGVVAVLSFAFSVVIGTWITRVFAQGERYRAVAESLREAQAEVAELSALAGAGAERERLSRELHDTLTQTLTGLVMLSEQAERALAADDRERARDRMARVREASRAAVAEARALVATTQPLGDGGLEEAIERVAGRLREDTGMRVVCELSPLVLDRELQVVLLRAAQEGLANARRHSRASSVTIRLGVRSDATGGARAILTVEDDGVGFGAESSGGALGGFGLSGLRDRVRLVGGEAGFGAGSDGGARLEVCVPLVEHGSRGTGVARTEARGRATGGGAA
ncbi:sensor histidine kinase [Leucobacter sp. CSA1]|uniref:histidine kinase n=2 Tax=Leucobacter chromiisoli TaxID=2796471 RepID=A0A934Q4Z0_9MICO|nr:sensor histidine kinase [Leucobacter chromiisoli]